MTYKTHVAFALLPAIELQNSVLHLNKELQAIFFLSVAISSLMPDLDEEHSYLSRRIPIVPMLLNLFGVEHRGITHRLIFYLISVGLLYFLYFYLHKSAIFAILLIGFSIGYFMHLAGDMLTKGGINSFFYPFFPHIKGVLAPRGARFYTGSITEFFIFLVLLILDFYLYFGSNSWIFLLKKVQSFYPLLR